MNAAPPKLLVGQFAQLLDVGPERVLGLAPKVWQRIERDPTQRGQLEQRFDALVHPSRHTHARLESKATSRGTCTAAPQS